MKFTIAICLIFTHYVCGDLCIVEKESAQHISTIEKLRKFYKHTKSFTTAETPQITQPTSLITYNKRFEKRYRKAPKLLKAWLQSNEVYTSFCMYKLAQHVLILNHPFNPWLTAYLSLFALFKILSSKIPELSSLYFKTPIIMKHNIYILLLVITIGFTQCCKEKPNNNSNDVPGLPPATQVGANTFGFLLNDQPWVPSGNNGSGNNLSINYDPGFSFGTFSIASYKVITSAINDNFIGIGIDSLNFYNQGHIYSLTKTSGFRVSVEINNCLMLSNSLTTNSNGFLYLDVYDKVKRIIAGRFELSISGTCGNYNLSNGRFDFKF